MNDFFNEINLFNELYNEIVPCMYFISKDSSFSKNFFVSIKLIFDIFVDSLFIHMIQFMLNRHFN